MLKQLLLYGLLHCLLIFFRLSACQSPAQDYDPPEPYIIRPVDYVGDFETLHEELERPLQGTVRTYYVAAEEFIWDYTSLTAKDISENDVAHFWVANSSTTLGHVYYKAGYREYTDASFSRPQERPQWQGLMGPILRAEVGDTIQVHFWNRASINVSMHPHGVFYDFDMEGAVYKGAAEKSFVRPGERFVYTWQVAPRAGPGPADPDSIVWGYHSHVTENDVFAGLFGAIVIYRPGTLTEATIANEVVTTVFAINENMSPYLSKTLAEIVPPDWVTSQGDPDRFELANIKQTVNGLMLAAPADLVLRPGKSTVWHLLSWGTDIDTHAISWENAVVQLYGKPVEQVRLLPASFRTVQVTPKSNGLWEFGFITGEPGLQGMTMFYTVDSDTS